MLRHIFLINIDNLYRGQRVAMWIFVVVLIVKTAQNVSVLIGGAAVIISADGIPLGTYSLEATQTVVSLWAFLGFIRLLICFLCFLILFQYRSLIPFMFVFLLLQDIGRYIIFFFLPVTRVGTPPGPTVNFFLMVLTIVGLVLSVLHRSNIQTKSA